MDIPTSGQREINTQETSYIHEAIRASGLDPDSMTLDWKANSVHFNRVVAIHPVLFDCRNALGTPCWMVRRASDPETSHACACGELVREAATGTYGSLKTAVAAALAEVVRARVLASIADMSERILKERQAGQPAACANDFITDCIHT